MEPPAARRGAPARPPSRCRCRCRRCRGLITVQHTGTIVLGGGQAGLATSAELAAVGDDHVVRERGRTAERWQSGRWDSLRLLTPNWMSRLPGHCYDGPDPEG